MMDRRRAERIHTHFKVSYLPLKGSGTEPIYTLSNDISETGINLDVDSSHKVGEAMELNIFSSHEEPPLKTFARVVWMENPPHGEHLLFRQSGLEFIDFRENQKNRLKKFIREVEKEDKTQTRDEFLEELATLCKAARSRELFIQTAEHQSQNLFGVPDAKLHLPECAIRDEKKLKAWTSHLKFNPSQIAVPLLAKGSLVGHLQFNVANPHAGISSSDFTRIKHWAACLAALCSSLFYNELNEHE